MSDEPDRMTAEERAKWRIRDDQCDVWLSERLPNDSACLLSLPCPRHGPRVSDEPTERDVEALAELLHGDIAWEDCVDGDWVHSHVGLTGFQARRVLASDWYAERIAQAHREGAVEVEARVKVALAELYDTEKSDALRVSRAMIALGERGPDLLAALERDRAAALRGDA